MHKIKLNRMKQILLTIKNPRKQIEAKDFLASCQHSPQWIGRVEDWVIRSFYFHEDKQHNSLITALLESESEHQIHAKALTPKEIYDKLERNRNRVLLIGVRQGLYGRVEHCEFGEMRCHCSKTGNYVLYCDKQNIRPTITVNDFFEVIDVRDFDAIRSEQETNDTDLIGMICNSMKLQQLENNPELLENLIKSSVLIEARSYDEGHPITEIIEEGDKVILVYNQDVVQV